MLELNAAATVQHSRKRKRDDDRRARIDTYDKNLRAH